ncbi:MAG: HAD family hydrolase [Planctomycetota bacterium]
MSFVSCIIWDLDGTLIDSAPDIAYVVNRVRWKFGMSPLEEGHIRAFLGDGANALIERAIFGIVDDVALRPSERLPRSAADVEEVVDQFRYIYSEYPVVKTTLRKGVAPILKHWQEQGTAQVVLTNKPHAITKEVLKALHLDKVFDLVLGRGGFDDEGIPLPYKPDARLGTYILDQTGASPEETFVVGDGVPDIEFAKNCGFKVIALLDGYTAPERLLDTTPNLDLAATSIQHVQDLLLANHDG